MAPPWLSFLTLRSKTKVKPEPSPLYINMSGDNAINGDYHVQLDPTDEEANRVTLKTSSGDINASLYLVGRGNPTHIEATSSRGDIFLILAKRESPVLMTVTAMNGSVRLIIPRDFDGLLTAMMPSATDNITLGQGLKRGADLIQDRTFHGGDRFVKLRVGPINGEPGLDHVDLYALNGEVIVDFVTET